MNMRARMTMPIQNAEKLPATRPDRTFKEAPPWPDALVTSRTWREEVLTKILVNSMINAPASVPQAMMADRTHQRFGNATLVTTPSTVCEIVKSPSNKLLSPKQETMET